MDLNTASGASSPESSLFVVEYEGNRVLIGRPASFAMLDRVVRQQFPEISGAEVTTYHTNALDICQGSWLEISESSWDAAVPMLTSLVVRTQGYADSGDESDCSGCEGSALTVGQGNEMAGVEPTITGPSVTVVLPGRRQIRIPLYHGDTADDLMARIQDREGIPPDQQRLIAQGNRLDNHTDLARAGVVDGATVHLLTRLTGGKPVIYLRPRDGEVVDASLRLALVSEWYFSVLHPMVPVRNLADGGQTLEWKVRARSDGIMLEENTNLEVSYLFYEAEALKAPTEPISPLASPSLQTRDLAGTEEYFDPSRPNLDASNSVLLNVDKVPHYLDASLKALGLDTEARTSFITYWLPSILKHKYIALRFLPQAAYERAAPLDVTPTPDLSVRVFMLFQGLKEEAAASEMWAGATRKAGEDVAAWREVVGVDNERSLEDKTLFRVIEWGGMEVL